jgi:Uma2 family endonuclease
MMGANGGDGIHAGARRAGGAMTTTKTKKKLTLDEFLALPEIKPAREYACGEVLRKPMPTYAHSLIQGFLVEILRQFLRRTGLGVAGPELRCTFGPPGEERSYVPDIAVIGRGRMPQGDARAVEQFRTPPDLAIEILSPRQAMGRFTDKVQFYLRHGVRLAWVIDPRAETVTVLAPGEDPRTLSGGDILDGGEVLPGFTVPVADIFAVLTPQLDA